MCKDIIKSINFYKDKHSVTITFNKKLKIENIHDYLSDDRCHVSLYDYHEQDCCEDVYVDWWSQKDILPHIKGKYFSILTIEILEGFGIKLGLMNYNGIIVDTNIPAYDIQNGLYSSNLMLYLKINNGNEIRLLDLEYATRCQWD